MSEIFKFDLTQHFNIAIIGKNNSKQNLVKNILNKYPTWDKYLISNSEQIDNYYDNYIPKENIQEALNSDINFINSDLIENKDKNKIIIIDIVIMKSLLNSLLTLLNFGRHYNTSIILLMSYPVFLLPEIRNNFNYVFMFGEQSNIQKQKLYNYYGSSFNNVEEFNKAFDNITITNEQINNNCYVLDNKKNKYYWYNYETSYLNNIFYTIYNYLF